MNRSWPDAVAALLQKGVRMPNPGSMDIGDEVHPDRISADSVTLYPGCRIHGADTVICAGAQIGREGPATVEDCQVGPRVELKGGYFQRAVFLEGSNLGLGAHVREGTILEEEASGAHCVGLKQTILFPFVTLGSLINFCDVLMAGGTSRRDHGEVGSSYVHFNFTPEGDKATASMMGDVPRGVMLRQPPVFLGGQGGMVGPRRVAYGTVIAAGVVLREDIERPDQLMLGHVPREGTRDRHPGRFSSIMRVTRNNMLYLANLVALEEWYRHVRRLFFLRQKLGERVYAGAAGNLARAKTERLRRLEEMAEKAACSNAGDAPGSAGKRELREAADALRELFSDAPAHGTEWRERFLDRAMPGGDGAGYLKAIQALPEPTREDGVRWLQSVVDGLCVAAHQRMPSLNVFPQLVA
ncbi:MAG: UDP-N-acetylglucosamine pyrophosphorylase [Kiritimatiellae bacterium]|nr:UDP-N-acetylglucosamine pyrophosphorylase [Kiritimatiellia bacterium]